MSKSIFTSRVWKSLTPFVAAMKEIVIILAVVIGGVWAVYTYNAAGKAEETKRAAARTLEYQKPYLDKQVEHYMEVAELLATLIDQPPDSEKWTAAYRRLKALWGTKMEVLADTDVRDQAAKVLALIEVFRHPGNPISEMEKSAYLLSSLMRISLKRSWRSEGDGLQPTGSATPPPPPPPPTPPSGKKK